MLYALVGSELLHGRGGACGQRHLSHMLIRSCLLLRFGCYRLLGCLACCLLLSKGVGGAALIKLNQPLLALPGRRHSW